MLLDFSGALAFLWGFLFFFIAAYAALKEQKERAEWSKWAAIFFILVSISLKLGG